MVQLVDGPCQCAYMVKRAPRYIRAVKDKLTGETDLLDQIEDTPNDSEEVFVYKLEEGTSGTVHLDGRGKNGKRFGGWYAMREYRHLPEVNGEELRDNNVWQAWATKQGVGEGHGDINFSKKL